MHPESRKVDVRLPGKGSSHSRGARPVHPIISMMKCIRTSRWSTKNSPSLRITLAGSHLRLRGEGKMWGRVATERLSHPQPHTLRAVLGAARDAPPARAVRRDAHGRGRVGEKGRSLSLPRAVLSLSVSLTLSLAPSLSLSLALALSHTQRRAPPPSAAPAGSGLITPVST